jgi:hypothetical protein
MPLLISKKAHFPEISPSKSEFKGRIATIAGFFIRSHAQLYPSDPQLYRVYPRLCRFYTEFAG